MTRRDSRRSTTSRKRRSAKGPSRPSPGSFISSVLRSWGKLSATTDPLDAEVFASTVSGLLDQPFGEPRHAPDHPVHQLIADIAARRSPDALSLLYGLAAVYPDPAATEARLQAARLAATGLPTPIWAASIGRAEFVEAWLATDEFGDQDLIVATFRHPGREPHTFNLTADHNFNGLFKQVGVGFAAQAIREGWAEVSNIPLLPISADELAARWLKGTTWYRRYIDPPVDDVVPRLMALVEARQRALPPVTVDVDEYTGPDPAAREALAAAVRASAPWAAIDAPDDVRDEALESVLDFRENHADGEIDRWSPIVVEMAMLDWLPRKAVMSDAAVEALPAVVRAVVRHAAGRRGLAEDLIQETLDAIAQFTPEYREAMADTSVSSPTKVLLVQMQREGVDLSDAEAISRWIQAFNERPVAERDAILGASTDAFATRLH